MQPDKPKNLNDHLANERTFLAWLRTGIGVMAFGFVVVKFSLFLKQFSLIFGNQSQNLASNGISQLASEQIVNGLFNVIGNYEQQNADKINQAFGTQIIK